MRTLAGWLLAAATAIPTTLRCVLLIGWPLTVVAFVASWLLVSAVIWACSGGIFDLRLAHAARQQRRRKAHR